MNESGPDHEEPPKPLAIAGTPEAREVVPETHTKQVVSFAPNNKEATLRALREADSTLPKSPLILGLDKALLPEGLRHGSRLRVTLDGKTVIIPNRTIVLVTHVDQAKGGNQKEMQSLGLDKGLREAIRAACGNQNAVQDHLENKTVKTDNNSGDMTDFRIVKLPSGEFAVWIMLPKD